VTARERAQTRSLDNRHVCPVDSCARSIVPSHVALFLLVQLDFRSLISRSSVYIQKAFDPTYLRYLKSRSRLLFSSALLLCFIHGSRYLSSTLCRHCHHYRYLPRSTEPIPLVLILLSYRSLHSITVATLPSSLPSRTHATVISVSQVILSLLSCRCSSSSSSSTSTSRIAASKPHRSSAPREGVLS
jgi:hypothetical protein